MNNQYRFLKLFSFFVMIALFTVACNKEEQFDDYNIKSLAENIEQFKEVERAYASIVSQPGLASKGIATQMVFLNNQGINTNFSIDRTISAHESISEMDVSTMASDILEEGLSLLTIHGFTTEAGKEIDQLFLNSGNTIKKLSKEEASFVKEQLSFMYFLATSPSFQTYASLQGQQLESKNLWKCFTATLYLAGLTTACASGTIYACLGIPYAATLVAQYCGNDGGYVDPCENSPNPCCGISCIQGYECNTQTGNCEEIPGYDCDGGCPPWEQCINNICVPL